MKRNNESGSNRSLEHTRIAREVFSAAESMGISDRNLVERLVVQVIDRMKKDEAAVLGVEKPLPGMEGLVPGGTRRPKRLPTPEEIQAVVEEILASKEVAGSDQEKEVKPKMKTVVPKLSLIHI